MRYKECTILLVGLLAASTCAISTPFPSTDYHNLQLHQLDGFFRLSYDDLTMPNNNPPMGLLGISYFTDITPTIYAGIVAYGAVIGTQGGLFTLGIGGGYHREFIPHWWGDVGLFAGGGGGKSSLVGGGLMLRPSLGIAYAWQWARLELHYSYIDFPNGKIHSQQIGLDLDLPSDFYYLSPQTLWCSLPKLNYFHLPTGKYLDFSHNDFAILLQEYRRSPGTRNTDKEIQDGTIRLVGAELDHYFPDNNFWWLKASGAFNGIPNGYMDVLGGLGHHWSLGSSEFSLVPQLGIGAGGGGTIDTGGGLLINPALGIEWPILSSTSIRLSSGYLWSPKGDFKAIPITGELLYHLDVATGYSAPTTILPNNYEIQGWRIQLLNQTYLYVQRSAHATTAPINLIGFQIDQLFTPTFFLSYQGSAAYQGYHAGGYATGMIGPGVQSIEFFNQRLQFFSEILIGAGGGGGLALSGGSILEPVVGFRYALTPSIGLQTSFSQVKALRDNLNAPVFNLGLTLRFDTLNRI